MQTRKIRFIFAWILCLAAGTVLPFGLFATDVPYFTQFEEPFELGDLAGQDDWQVDGAAEIRERFAPTSDRAIVLDPGSPPTRIWRSFSGYEGASGMPVYFDFFIRPAVGSDPDSWTLVEAGESILLFDENNGRGGLSLLDASQEDLNWIPADFSFPFMPGSFPFFRVTLRQDDDRSHLWVDGRFVGSLPRAGNDGSGKELVFAIVGNRINTVEFADFYTGSKSPLPAEAESGIASGSTAGENFETERDGFREDLLSAADSAAGTDSTNSKIKELLFSDPASFGSGMTLQVFTPLE